jgi:AcrR family transcriptional regulator
MIHHYFGSKKALYEEILSLFSERILEVPIRIISEPPQTRETLIARLEIFIAETLAALTANPDLYRTIVRERVIVDAIAVYNDGLIRFLEAGKKAGIVRPELDSAMLTGMILDRLGNQILYATWIDEVAGANVLNDAQYSKRWLQANIDILLHGILTQE